MTTKAKDRVRATGEVFTPRSLIHEMLNKLPNEVWFDPNKTWLEPSAGDGNFLVEIKARLMQAGHDEAHILENMLFSVELIDDNHWTLQHRLGYLIDGEPNAILNPENFSISKISQLTQDLNEKNPYTKIGCERDEVLHHRNHVCDSALTYDMSFGRTQDTKTSLPCLQIRDLGEWPKTDTPDVGEKYVVEKMLGTQPNLQHEVQKPEPKVKALKPEKAPKVEKPKAPPVSVQEKPVVPSIDETLLRLAAPYVARGYSGNELLPFMKPELRKAKIEITPEIIAKMKELFK